MIKISGLEIENVKRVKAVHIEPSAAGLTIIGGRNNQGKTSVLDSIAWTLGGNKYRPSSEQREGSVTSPFTRITLNNGIVVERSGKNSSLKVTDPSGKKAGQQLLDAFVEQFALSLPRFMNAGNKDKADILLKVIGVGDKLYELERKESETYNRRHAVGQIADQKKKHAAELPYYQEAPAELISASELIRQQQDILARNGENQRLRDRRNALEAEAQLIQRQIDELTAKLALVSKDLEIARHSARDLQDESTEELEHNIENIEAINIKARANMDKERAEDEAQEYARQYEELTVELNDIRKAKTNLLQSAALPLPGLSVEDGELLYNGRKWDCISGSDQLMVSTAIVRKLNPDCGFVLLDKLEQMDIDTLNAFSAWLETEGLQVIATRVSTGEECTIVIEDGYVKEPEQVKPANEPRWKAGVF